MLNCQSFLLFIYSFISLKSKLYNNNGELKNRNKLKQQDLEGRERLY